MIKYTELKATNRHNLMDVLPLQKPFTILIEPTNLCNFRCVQCFQSIEGETYFTRNRMNMPMGRFSKIVQQLQRWTGEKIKVLKLSLYGEPFLNPAFCEMLKMIKEADIAERVETTTNASLLTRAISKQIVWNQLDYMRVSIYGVDQQKHQSRTSSAMKITEIYDNLRILQEEKRKQGSDRPFVSVKMLDSYQGENDRFMQMYQDVADELYFDKPHGWIKVDDMDFIKKYYQDDDAKVKEDLVKNSSPRIACPMAFTTMAIRSNGAVSPCCVDFIGGTNLGYMDERNLQEIWRSDAWIEFQRMQLQNRKNENYSCARCDIFYNDHYIKDNIDGFPVEKLRMVKDVMER